MSFEMLLQGIRVLIGELTRRAKIVIIVFVIVTGYGLFLAFTSPILYRSEIIFVQQDTPGKTNLGSLGGLASLAGVNLGNQSVGNNGIPPSLYPRVFENTNLKKRLLYSDLEFQTLDTTLSFVDYYSDWHELSLSQKVSKYTIGLPKTLLESFSRSNHDEDNAAITSQDYFNKYPTLNSNEELLGNALLNTVSVNPDVRNGFIRISSEMPDPLAAAELTNKTFELLQKFMIELKSRKAAEEFTFIEERYEVHRERLLEKQIELAKYKDQNNNLSQNSSLIDLRRLESDYNLILTVFNDLGRQLEQARIRVEEDTPVFTVIQPVSIPNERSAPKRKTIVITWALVGILIACFVGLFPKMRQAFMKLWSRSIY